MQIAEGPFPTPDAADAGRLAAIERYGVLDTPAEAEFDDIAAIAADACLAPVALISFVDWGRQWFKARIGFEACETPLEQSVCAHALAEPDMLVVPNLALDPRTRGNLLVSGPPYARFYAGAVLRTPEGYALGTLCVLDTTARPEGLTTRQANVLRALARQIMSQLELRRVALEGRREITESAVVKEQALRLRLAIDATRLGIFDYDLVADRLDWDDRVRELFGATPDEPVSYEGSFLAGLHPDDRDAADSAVKAALDPSGPGLFDHEYRTIAARDGSIRWIAARGRAVVEDGKVVRFVGTVRDVTARRAADEAVAAILERYRLVGAVTKDAIWDWDLVTDHVVWNEALTTVYGHRVKDVEPTPKWWLDHVHPEDRERVRGDIFSVINGTERDWAHDYRFRRADGSYVDVFDRGSMIRGPNGAPLRMIGAMFDNSVRKAEEERQQLLNHELSHRMKNLLTLVQAIAAQTMRSSDTLEDAQRALSGRLVALSRAHDIVVGGRVDGARLSEIVVEAVRVHVDKPDRVWITGPNVEIGAKAALSVVLLMHELATNAAKYGSLSNADGRVTIDWRLSGRTGEEVLRLVWAERGGPPAAAPSRQGFGTKLIERGLSAQLGAGITLGYAPEGATCVLEAPLERLRQTG